MATLLAARGLSGLAQAVALVLLARWVEVQTFGAVSAWMGVFLVVAAVFDLGLSGFLLVHRAKGENGAVRTAIRINRLSSLCAALVLVILVGSTQTGNLLIALVLLATSSALEKNTDTLLSIALADGRVTLAGLSIIVRRVGCLGLLVLLAAIGLEPILAYGSAVLMTAVAAQVQIYAYIRHAVDPTVPPERWRVVLKDSSKYMAQFVSGQARTLDTSVVALVAGVTAAGYYGAATRLSAPVLLVPGAISSVLTPATARTHRTDARKSARRVIFVTAAIALLAGAAAPLAPSIIALVLGSDYGSAAVPFALSLPATVFIGFTSPLAGVLQAQGHARYVALASVSSVVALLGLVAVGSLLAGAVGASIGLLIAAFAAWLIIAARAATLKI